MLMMKQVKYALMALCLIGGLKLIQTLFIDQEYRKRKPLFQEKIVKESSEKEEQGFTDLDSEEEIDPGTEDEQDAKEEPISIVSEVEEQPNTNTYPTLDDLKSNYLSIKNASLQDGRSREDVVIRYYKHEKDESKVYALKKLRYYIHEKPATETKGLGSNVIYYGDQVKVEDIQIVAFTLLENGIPLKSIERSKFDWKSNAIEIGTDSVLIGTANLSKSDIQNFSL